MNKLVFLCFLFIGCSPVALPSGNQDELEIVKFFLEESFKIIPKTEIDLKLKKILRKNHRIDIEKMAGLGDQYNSTDYDVFEVPTKRMILLGQSKDFYFIVYDKGGRVPVRILSTGSLIKKRADFVDLILHDGTLTSMEAIKEDVKNKKYTNNW
ncbi:MAG: hypothetical protein ACRBFS_27260 [Aureispira sp.]